MQDAFPLHWDIYEEHLDEAAFLWEQWQRARVAVHYDLQELVEGPEERLLAHLDALVLGGSRVADRLLIPILENAEAVDAALLFVATWVLLQAEDIDHWEYVLRTWASLESTGAQEAMGCAFGLSNRVDLPERLGARVPTLEPMFQAMALDALAAWGDSGLKTVGTEELSRILNEATASELPALLRAVQRCPDKRHSRVVSEALSHVEPEVREAALEAARALEIPDTRQASRAVLAKGLESTRLALAQLAFSEDLNDEQLVIQALASPHTAANAAWALGFSGSLRAGKALCAALENPELGPIAADSLAIMAGFRIEGALEQVGESSVQEKGMDPSEALPELHPEDELPQPNVEAVRTAWQHASADWQPVARYLAGRPRSEDEWRSALTSCTLWRFRAFRLALGADVIRRSNWRGWGRGPTVVPPLVNGTQC